VCTHRVYDLNGLYPGVEKALLSVAKVGDQTHCLDVVEKQRRAVCSLDVAVEQCRAVGSQDVVVEQRRSVGSPDVMEE
jgi:hypothetical protein